MSAIVIPGFHIHFGKAVEGGKERLVTLGKVEADVLDHADDIIEEMLGIEVETSWKVEDIPADVLRKQIMRGIRKRIPLGMDRHKEAQDERYLPQGYDIDKLEIVKRRSQSILQDT